MQSFYLPNFSFKWLSSWEANACWRADYFVLEKQLKIKNKKIRIVFWFQFFLFIRLDISKWKQRNSNFSFLISAINVFFLFFFLLLLFFCQIEWNNCMIVDYTDIQANPAFLKTENRGGKNSRKQMLFSRNHNVYVYTLLYIFSLWNLVDCMKSYKKT